MSVFEDKQGALEAFNRFMDDRQLDKAEQTALVKSFEQQPEGVVLSTDTRTLFNNLRGALEEFRTLPMDDREPARSGIESSIQVHTDTGKRVTRGTESIDSEFDID